MTSDYFIVPTMPDYFSVMAIDSLASIIPKWCAWAVKAQSTALFKDAAYPFPIKSPKFLGTIIQKYRPRESQTPSAAFQKWIDDINKAVKDKLIPALRDNDLLLEEKVYKSVGLEAGDALIQMSDFNSLIALSQQHKVPVFGLSDQQIGHTGTVLEITKKSMENFGKLYSEGAEKILSLL